MALNIKLSERQTTISAATSLLGNGSKITNLNYNKFNYTPDLTIYATYSDEVYRALHADTANECNSAPSATYITKANGNDFNISGNLIGSSWISGTYVSIANNGTDFIGVASDYDKTGETITGKTICIKYDSVTEYHRCYINDELCDNTLENILNFKLNYTGRVVIASGKIATAFSKIDDNNNSVWYKLFDKNGIRIEQALPIVQLSRIKKDKRVFGVLSNLLLSDKQNDRLAINSVGEGGIWVVNTNGNIENGDYLQSSDELGYAEKQDDDILHNYTVGKSTIDCNFELNSDKYETIILKNGVLASFIACTYHCG